MNKAKLFLGSLTLMSLTHAGFCAIVQTSQSSTVSWSSTPWSGKVSATDLINSDQTTLASSSATAPTFGSGGMNDGSSTGGNGSIYDNTFYYLPSEPFPVEAVYNLNTSINTLGYDITSIESFMGWSENALHQANQTYTVKVRTVGSAEYTDLTTVSYTPFGANDTGSYHYTHVEISEDNTGILASGVDSILFTFTAPATTLDGSFSPGTVIRELDVYGSATVIPEPASALLLALAGGFAGLYRRLFRR